MDYKSTLNLPKTDFPMKANLPQREPEMLARWAQERLYERIQESRQGCEQYILHDGPPYANGRIHIGHALNKILKDIIVKSKTMSGYHVPYVPGWDCHGLPIEHQVLKELGDKKRDLDARRFRHLAPCPIEDEPMRQDGLIRRTVIRDDTGQQGAMEPAAMLVGPFQIQLGRPPLARLQHRGITHTGLKPYVENILFLLELRSPAPGAPSVGRNQHVGWIGKPVVRAMLSNQIRHMVDYPRMGQYLFTGHAGEGRNRRAPDPLT